MLGARTSYIIYYVLFYLELVKKMCLPLLTNHTVGKEIYGFGVVQDRWITDGANELIMQIFMLIATDDINGMKFMEIFA